MIRNKKPGYLSLTGGGINLFSDGDLEQIHQGALEVLQKTGIYVQSEKARKIFGDAGAIVEGEIVKIPEFLINEAIRTSPGNVLYGGREPEYDCMVQPGRVHFLPVGQPCFINDPDTGHYRQAKLDDVGKASRLVDALDQYDFNDTIVIADDVPVETDYFHYFATQAKNTSKFVMTVPAMPEEKMDLFMEMPLAIAGSKDALRARPFVAIGSCVSAL